LFPCSPGGRFDATLPPVDDKDYRVSLKITGSIDRIAIKLAPPTLSRKDIQQFKETEAKMNAASGIRHGGLLVEAQPGDIRK
jgi:hypothetical protein